jgi:hypothetical protein
VDDTSSGRNDPRAPYGAWGFRRRRERAMTIRLKAVAL